MKMKIKRQAWKNVDKQSYYDTKWQSDLLYSTPIKLRLLLTENLCYLHDYFAFIISSLLSSPLLDILFSPFSLSTLSASLSSPLPSSSSLLSLFYFLFSSLSTRLTFYISSHDLFSLLHLMLTLHPSRPSYNIPFNQAHHNSWQVIILHTLIRIALSRIVCNLDPNITSAHDVYYRQDSLPYDPSTLPPHPAQLFSFLLSLFSPLLLPSLFSIISPSLSSLSSLLFSSLTTSYLLLLPNSLMRKEDTYMLFLVLHSLGCLAV